MARKTNKQIILDYLETNLGSYYCDDCISILTKVTPRQQVNQKCREALAQGILSRGYHVCNQCGKMKKSNAITVLSDNDEPEIILSFSQNDKGYRLKGHEFEERVGRYFSRKFNCELRERKLDVGPNKTHKFDLVSHDCQTVIECKSYTWTKVGGFPSAKISTANETLFYLSRIVAERKMLVMQDNLNKNGDSLVKVYVRRNNGLMDDVEVWLYVVGTSLDKDEAIQIRKKSEVWYDRLRARTHV